MKIYTFIFLFFIAEGYLSQKSVAKVAADNKLIITQIKTSVFQDKKTQKPVNFATVVLNEMIKIREIEYNIKNERVEVKYPYYTTKSGKEIPQVTVINKRLSTEIGDAIRASTIPVLTSSIPVVTYEITAFVPYTRAKKGTGVQVYGEITFNSSLAIQVRVMDGTRGLWVAWPARAPDRAGYPWVDQVIILDDTLKEEIETVLTRRVKDMRQEGTLYKRDE